MNATTERERLAQIHALLTSLDLNGQTTREGTAWGSILRESIEISEAQPVQQPNRDALFAAISRALDGFSKDEHGDFIALQAERIYNIATDAVLAALAVPATGEVEYTVGMVNSDGSVSADDDDLVTGDIEEAREWVQEAIAGGTFSNAVLVSRPVSKWEVTP